jgi:hypothetical protein
MKLLLWLFLAFTPPVYAQADDALLTVDKTPRMAEIEQKFHMELAGILRTPEGVDFLCYMAQAANSTFGHFPVVFLPDASDTDVDAAIITAEHCAEFYEANLKAQKEPAPSPNPSPPAAPGRQRST